MGKRTIGLNSSILITGYTCLVLLLIAIALFPVALVAFTKIRAFPTALQEPTASSAAAISVKVKMKTEQTLTVSY